MKAYYYIFHRLYTATRLIGSTKQPHINATFQITIVDSLLVWAVLYLAIPRWANQTLSGHFLNALILGVLLFLLNYLLFLFNQRYEKILRVFKKESHRTQVVGSVLTGVVVLALVYGAVAIQAAAGH